MGDPPMAVPRCMWAIGYWRKRDENCLSCYVCEKRRLKFREVAVREERTGRRSVGK